MKALGLPRARRALDAQGWDSDVALLRKQLAAVERRLHQTRLAARLDVGAPPPQPCAPPAPTCTAGTTLGVCH